ncbi:MAG: PLP-dependent transferase, partial [Oscillospiraceae bacterium]|nr:PLP-dependent transferase [Oscillospiraceae bacterium]
EAKGIHDRLLRLSVGLESCDDLLTDLKQAINGRG